MLKVSALIAIMLGFSAPAAAFTLKVSGLVTHYHGGDPMPGALVRVYKDGVKVSTVESNAFGRYNVRLENDADYVFRFSAPGFVTKCFGVDTHGLVWEGEDNVKELYVEMTMLGMLTSMDLSFFDMPMGRLRFEPATGLVSWNKEYESWVRPRVEKVMAEYELRWSELAGVQAAGGEVPRLPARDDQPHRR